MAEANKHRLPADRWDAVVIATHWLVAGGFVCNRLLNEAGGVWHERIGLTVAGLVLLRLLWGLTLASGPARLSQFLPSWTRVRHHVAQIRSGELPNQLEHNPLGALAIWLFWLGLLAVAVTGWGQDQSWGDAWPLADIHAWLVDGLTVLVVVHVLAVILMSHRMGQNLLRRMLPLP